MIYYIEFSRGATLVNAKSPQSATKYILQQYGLDAEPIQIRKATDEDKAHVQAFGGMTHEV